MEKDSYDAISLIWSQHVLLLAFAFAFATVNHSITRILCLSVWQNVSDFSYFNLDSILGHELHRIEQLRNFYLTEKIRFSLPRRSKRHELTILNFKCAAAIILFFFILKS